MSDQQVLSLCEEFWQWRISDDPELAGFVGYSQFTDRWMDISEAAYLKRDDQIRDFLSRAKLIDVSSCSPEVILSYRMFVNDLDMYLKGLTFKSYLMPIGSMEGIQVEANVYINNTKYDSEEDFNKYICRLKALPQRIQQVVDALKTGSTQGILLYESSLNDVPRVLEGLVSKSAEELDLYKPCLHPKEGMSSTFLDQIKEEAKSILGSEVQPAFKVLKTYLEEEYIPKCRVSPGISSLPDGKAMYQQCLDYHLSYSTTPQEVHNLGKQEVARIQLLIINIARKEGLTEDLSEIGGQIKERQNKFKSAEEAHSFVKDLCFNRIQPKLSKYFKDIPDLPLNVTLAPEYQKNYPAGYYMGGTQDGSRQGAYYVNAHDLDNKCLPFILPCVSLHEGEPGHHTQAAHCLSSQLNPNFRRFTEEYKYYLAPGKWAKHTAYLEGWGLYCESLGEEMGVYQNNYELLGRYSAEVFRAARMVVDTGLHAFGWSRAEAIQYLVDNAMMLEAEAAREIDRYISWPGQASAYKYGELKIWEFRCRAEKELGDDFDLREFHFRLLSCGSVPMIIIEEIVNQFIEEWKH